MEKIYVFCPANTVTGGVELLHQLVHTLNEFDKDAYIFYFDNLNQKSVDPEYSKYNIKIGKEIIDNEFTIVVFSETTFHFNFNFKKAKKMFWWLSVDNFYISNYNHLHVREFFGWNFSQGIRVFFARFYKLILKGDNYFKNSYSINMLRKQGAINLYQSSYAQHFLYKNKFEKVLPLKDYINDDYFIETNISKNSDILYNPKKGLKSIEFLIRKYGHKYNFRPIINMTRAEVKDLLSRSLIYIDLGNHPGKDRIPREALMSGCFVITNKKGSASFYEDVSIDSRYKIGTRKEMNSIDQIFDYLINNPLEARNDFVTYKRMVKNEKKQFISDLKIVFNLPQ